MDCISFARKESLKTEQLLAVRDLYFIQLIPLKKKKAKYLLSDRNVCAHMVVIPATYEM